MARYDYESQIGFAQEQFDKARKYNEEQAKKQDKFTERLLKLNTVVKGANYLINQRAAELDKNQFHKKVAYQNLLNRTENIRNNEAERLKSNLSVQDYLENQYYNQLSAEASTAFSSLSPAQYSKALRKEASELAQNNVNNYKNIVNYANNMPDIANFNAYWEQSSDIPRNIVDWFSKGTKKFIKKETPETIKIKNNKAEDALYGTSLFNKFGDLSTALRAYDVVTDKGIDAVKVINKLNLTTGALVPDASQMITKKVEDKPKGTIEEKTFLYQATRKTDGSGLVEYLPENIIELGTNISRTDSDRVNVTDVERLFEKVKLEHHDEIHQILKNTDGQPTFTQYQEARNLLSMNPNYYKINWSDERAKEDSFQKWYSIQIIDVKDDNGQRIAQDIDRDGIYTFKGNQLDWAADNGFDAASMRRKYNNLASNAGPTKPLNEEEINLQGAQKLEDIISKEKKLEFNNIFSDIENEDNPFLQIFSNKIQSSQSTNKTIIDLGIVDLNQVFPNFGLQGESRLLYNREDNNLYIRN